VNQSGPFDSRIALDPSAASQDIHAMNTANVTHPPANADANANALADANVDANLERHDPIVLRRVEPARNMARWYTLSLT
jgi:hypothetical protein